jgi:LPS-assembly lipoprotein
MTIGRTRHCLPIASSRAERRASTPRRLRWAAYASALALAGCGFHLEGAGTLPPAMAKTYLAGADPHSDFILSLTDALRLHGSEIVSSPEAADAVVSISRDDTGQRVLSVSARNIPREYEVFYAVTFSLQVGSESLIEPQSIVVTRSYTYDETQVLAKAAEEGVLRRALADDLARRVVRRIQALGTSTPPPHT